MKIFSSRTLFSATPAPAVASLVEDCLKWLRDPLSHPALEAMSERELADLPFGRPRAIDACD